MTDKELFNKRVVPAFNQAYKEAENAFGQPLIVTIENLNDLAVEVNGKYIFPYDAFYLDNDRFKQIVNDACKGLRSWYVWPYKSEIIYTEEDIQSFMERMATLDENSWEYKDLERKVRNNPINIQRHELWKEYEKERAALGDRPTKAQMKPLAQKYNLSLRCRDAEAISFTLNLHLPTPTSNKKKVDRLAELYKDRTLESTDAEKEDIRVMDLFMVNYNKWKQSNN